MTRTKKELRAVMAAKKKAYAEDIKRLKSKQISEKLLYTDEYRQAENILCYWSMSDEVSTHEFVIEAARNKRVFLPVVSGNILLIREFTGVENLVEGTSFSIPEPDFDTEEIEIRDIDLVIVPGVAFDLGGGRLGRGKGFYDKLLAGADVYKIGICFDFQLVDEIPRDEHDVLMDKLFFG